MNDEFGSLDMNFDEITNSPDFERTNDDLACEHCGSFDLIYLGVDDGLGEYGEDICDTFECQNCGHHQVGECG